MATTWQRRQRNTTAALVAGGVLLAALLALTFYIALNAFEAEQQRGRRDLRIDQLRQLITALVDSETGVRGYVITGDPAYLEPYHRSAGAIDPMVEAVDPELGGAEPVLGLRRLVAERRATLQQVIDTARRDGMEAAAIAIREGGGKALMDQIRGIVGREMKVEATAIAALSQRSAADTALLGAAVAAVVLLGAGLSIYQFWVFRSEIARRGRSESELQARTSNIHLLSELATALHATEAPEESFSTIEAFAGRLVSGPGALYVYNHSRDQLMLNAEWDNPGGAIRLPDAFPPEQCWALRRGAPHAGRKGAPALNCAHVIDETHSYLCLPIHGQGKVYGVLHLLSPAADPEAAFADSREVARGLSEQLSLALANIELRERLRNMAIRDPLTGLYNRRFLEEVLERELSRADRLSTDVAVALLDIDHFKSFNDRHGHAVGDEVLKRISAYLAGAVRRTDILCRFGGEELILILPDCAVEEGVAVCEKLRAGVARLDLSDAHPNLEQLTASFGVTSYPKICADKQQLVQSADHAMYEAKRAGRNRVAAAAAAVAQGLP